MIVGDSGWGLCGVEYQQQQQQHHHSRAGEPRNLVIEFALRF
jgi:hypothetical protein